MKDIITLSNGKKVANFSSPHDFIFTDGIILPAVSPEDVEKYKIIFIENIDEENGDVELTFKITPEVRELMNEWLLMWANEEVDVVFCPMPMIVALKEHFHWKHILKESPFRAIRMEDRITKLISIDKQCL